MTGTFDPWAHAEHYTDEPWHEIQYGINVGDPAECCDPVLLTDDEGTAAENAQIVRDPQPMRRTVTTTFGPWEPVDFGDDDDEPVEDTGCRCNSFAGNCPEHGPR